MPKIRRDNLPPRLLAHLGDRIRLREVNAEDLIALREWLDSNPEVPREQWFRAFGNFFICGEGELIKTVLSRRQSPIMYGKPADHDSSILSFGLDRRRKRFSSDASLQGSSRIEAHLPLSGDIDARRRHKADLRRSARVFVGDLEDMEKQRT